MLRPKTYFWNVLVGVDQLANALLAGDPDETLSSRAGKRINKRRWAYWLCRVLHVFDPGHCEKSIETDEGRRKAY